MTNYVAGGVTACLLSNNVIALWLTTTLFTLRQVKAKACGQTYFLVVCYRHIDG